MAGKLKVTQVKSTISHIARNRATVAALGLHGIGSTSIVADNPATRGMVRQVRFLVTVEELPEGEGGTTTPARARPSARQGGDEHASERTAVRERGRTGANAAARRTSAGSEEKA
jgi:large subunit ribosomal protein L30